jgi:hypothetical protein
MKKFIVTYHAPAEAVMQTAGLSAEEQAKGMEPWMTWAQNCGDKLVDLGAPLTNGNRLAQSGISPSTLNVSGYSILQAENMDEAKALLKDHPHTAWNADCSIEVYETMPLPGM